MMKVCLKTLCLFFGITFLSITAAFSQQATEVIHINNIPADGFLLDKGWKFQLGDDPMYAQSAYDDSAWSQINPTLDIHDSLPQIPEGDICWI